MAEGKAEYLQMIQDSISRMSTNSAIFKGFAATIVAGVAALSYDEMNCWVLGLSFLPVFAFAVLDVYYLRLERRFRYLFDCVRRDEHEIDFAMEPARTKCELCKAKARIVDCLKSPSIYLFYPLMAVILGTVFILKLKGVL